MSKAIHAHYLGAMVAMALIAALLIVLVTLTLALRSTPTAGEQGSSPVGHAISASGTGGTLKPGNPNIERHAEVVQRLANGRLH